MNKVTKGIRGICAEWRLLYDIRVNHPDDASVLIDARIKRRSIAQLSVGDVISLGGKDFYVSSKEIITNEDGEEVDVVELRIEENGTDNEAKS